MKRWNVACIFFFAIDGERRTVDLVPNTVNVITGASGTGKSALIKAIDYCLGSKNCGLPAFVRRRCTAVGVKWTAGDDEMIIGRIIPPVGQHTSTKMFASSGRSLQIPNKLSDFEGATTVSAAKALIERAFGIGDTQEVDDSLRPTKGRASVRQIPPYLFVTKDVIYSETVLLHGLDDKDKAPDIVESMPYFLRASTEATTAAERKLRQLKRALEIEEFRTRVNPDSTLSIQARGLLSEANRIGLAPAPTDTATESELLGQLQAVIEHETQPTQYPGEESLNLLQEERRRTLAELSQLKRESQAAQTASREAASFGAAVHRQHEKLLLAEHLSIEGMATACPICESPTEKGIQAAKLVQLTLTKVREESQAVDRVKPGLGKHVSHLSEQISLKTASLKAIDTEIQGLIGQIQEGQKLESLSQLRSYFRGRASFFLESARNTPTRPARDLEALRNEISLLEADVNSDAKEMRIRQAETRISQHASEIFGRLPTVAPCTEADLIFLSKKPEVTVVEKTGAGSVLRMPDIGSDQNYLAIHIALSFALQRYFRAVNAPVPGLLVLDQISRPYFPAGENTDESEIKSEDEDVQAMRAHIDFLFDEVASQTGLQVLLIEHAYFPDDARFVGAVRERWTRASRNALIPLDWPTRDDV